jgi:hypothetical protein
MESRPPIRGGRPPLGTIPETVASHPAIAALLVILFGVSGLCYIDIQEDAMARNRELAELLDSLSRDELGQEHEAYRFGLGQVFGRGVGFPPLRTVRHWLGGRMFNPFLYGTVLCLMMAVALLFPLYGN